ncbi:MAG: patatin-like phospholipase family protein [Gemmatimonadaceae bacterium]
MLPIRNLVFQGGGVKGLAYAGVLEELEREAVTATVTRVAGTSAGAIVAALIALGITGADLQAALTHTSFTAFVDGGWGDVGDAERLLKGMGMHPGATFVTWMRQRISELTANTPGGANPDLTFAQLSALATASPSRFRELFVVTTDLTAQTPVVLGASTTPDLQLWKGVRMSMSIPFFFEPVEHEGKYYVDGGISWNYPIDLFDGLQRQPVAAGSLPFGGAAPASGDETIGFSLGSAVQIAAEGTTWAAVPQPISDFRSYVGALAGFILDEANALHLDAAAHARTVLIDNAGIKATQFTITPAQAETLEQNGRNATQAFLAARRGNA